MLGQFLTMDCSPQKLLARVPDTRVRLDRVGATAFLRKGIPGLAFALCLLAASAADSISSYESKPAELAGTIPIETSDLAGFMEFGLGVCTAKTSAEVMKLWRRYDVSNVKGKSRNVNTVHGRVERSSENTETFATAIVEWVPNDSKDPGSMHRAIALMHPDERAFIGAIVDRARMLTGATNVTRIELKVKTYTFVSDQLGTRVCYFWKVFFDEGAYRGLLCYPCGKKDEGIQLGKSDIYLSSEGDLYLEQLPRDKNIKKWDKAIVDCGGVGPPEKRE